MAISKLNVPMRYIWNLNVFPMISGLLVPIDGGGFSGSRGDLRAQGAGGKVWGASRYPIGGVVTAGAFVPKWQAAHRLA
ncbi:hypothetical protein J2X50_001808 [Aminobacter sp. BE322]